MKHDWILDVIADLATFAQENGLQALAEQLEDAKLVAATEMSQSQAQERNGRAGFAAGNATQVGNLHRTHGGCKDAG